MAEQKAIIVGISGCSSSGKTTLARLLRDIFPNAFVLHEDDFYRPESEQPKKGDLLDWDSIESLNVPQMERSLTYIRQAGKFPPDLDSKEDQNSVGACPVPDSKIAELKQKVADWTRPGQPGHDVLVPEKLSLCLLDGFLLYYPPRLDAVMSSIDLRLFLLVSRDKAIQRRKARTGYVTLEGFWEDPEGYVEEIVWPNYAEAHAWLFEGGDVEGKVDEAARASRDIRVQQGEALDVDMSATLEWAVNTILEELPPKASARKNQQTH
ncbi:hypothetical protein GGTG_04317 [Gaeumannomyces tritici R3-111a-1]|uniref:Nicotinamide riboside kinase 1 n=1 Tax=Gaeumannomyces tritici (strain R3-111a-1) TaxID=644352 RepID=J3NSR8_GAET3|nr:hypothetical protein GGTG_04317 [Gaeumannomyces tritici R3-111a-1]EJT79231.1 hypothetical protein GGTG_04317 [Gaeumannomyces tritici R3-111a-1]